MPARPKAKVYRGTARNIARLSRALARGELVAVPTETVYGLAANALDVAAVARIFRAKGRPANDPLIVHIHSLRQLESLAITNPSVTKVARAFWPGPLTLVLPKKDCVPELVTSGLPSVAVRMPSHPLFRTLLRTCDLPLAAPSANLFGYVSPTTAQHVRDGLAQRISHILDGGPCAIGVESTILDLRNPAHPAILRPGAIEREALECVLGVPVKPAEHKKPAGPGAALAPGMLSRHYSPRTPIALYDTLPQPPSTAKDKTEAFVYFRRPAWAKGPAAKNIFWFSRQGDLREAAKTLFALLRQLDQAGYAHIHAERAPGDEALALAVNDRLGRAAAKR